MTAKPPADILALSVDLMDRSKISGALASTKFVRSITALTDAAHEGSIALVDLGRVEDPALLRAVSGRVIAFGSHVAQDVLDAAAEAGVEALPRSLFFRRLGDGSLI